MNLVTNPGQAFMANAKTSLERIKSDLLACEAAIDSGRVMNFPPSATTAIPDDVMAVIRGSRLG